MHVDQEGNCFNFRLGVHFLSFLSIKMLTIEASLISVLFAVLSENDE